MPLWVYVWAAACIGGLIYAGIVVWQTQKINRATLRKLEEISRNIRLSGKNQQENAPPYLARDAKADNRHLP